MIIQIEYKNGARNGLKENAATDYFTAVDAKGRGHRIRGVVARQMIDEFDERCNEGMATLIEIDEDQVAYIRRRFK